LDWRFCAHRDEVTTSTRADAKTVATAGFPCRRLCRGAGSAEFPAFGNSAALLLSEATRPGVFEVQNSALLITVLGETHGKKGLPWLPVKRRVGGIMGRSGKGANLEIYFQRE